MTYNCLPGDLAMIVKSNSGNEGKLVDVLGEAQYGPGFHAYPEGMHLWWVRSLGRVASEFGAHCPEFNFPDAYLRAFVPVDLLGAV